MPVPADERLRKINDRSEIRSDLIKRLFAVAISVGFATTLASMECIKDGRYPNFLEQQQIAVLLTALLATVASWDGYLLSIKSKPLVRTPRYWTDIVLVFIYMLLLISAKHPSTWLPVLCIIFAIYVLWDALTILEYRNKYILDGSDNGGLRILPKVYWKGLLGREAVSAGPIITLVWCIYFLILYNTSPSLDAGYNVFVACVSTCAALIIYRDDKIEQKSSRNITRIAIAIGLLIITHISYFIAGKWIAAQN